MLNNRASGILLHPTSLPGPLGSGDFGLAAYQFIDWLKQAGQTYWQMLPLGEIGPGNSPYMSCSAFAGNILLIDLAELVGQGWLSQSDLVPHPEFHVDHIEFSVVVPFRLDCLRRAASNFFSSPGKTQRSEYDIFCTEESLWLTDYALFKTIEHRQSGCGWSYWPIDLAQRNPDALRRVSETCGDEINF